MKTPLSLVFLIICIVAVSVLPISTSAEIEPLISGVYWVDVYENTDSIAAVGVSGENVIGLGKSDEEAVIWSTTTGRGELRWHRKLGRGELTVIQKLPSGEVIVAGKVNDTMLWLVRIGEEGGVKWGRLYGNPSWHLVSVPSLIIDPRGNVLVAAELNNPKGAMLLKLNGEGCLIWQKFFPGLSSPFVQAGPHGEIFLAGLMSPRLVLIKMDGEGILIWGKAYKPSQNTLEFRSPVRVALLPEERIILASTIAESIYTDVALLTIDSDSGSPTWGKRYDFSTWDYVKALKVLPSENVLLAGDVGVPNKMPAGWIFRADSRGNVLWSFTFESPVVAIHVKDISVDTSGNIFMGMDLGGGALVKLPPDGELPGFEMETESIPTVSSLDVTPQNYLSEFRKYANLMTGSYYDVTPWFPEVSRLYEVVLSGILQISSIPSSANVSIVGSYFTYKGTTPISLEVPAGDYIVNIRKEEYEDQTLAVSVNVGETKTVTVELRPKFGYLEVNSEPTGAEVYVDDYFLGVTPLSAVKLQIGSHELRLKIEGYEPYVGSFSINPGETTKINAVLRAKDGTLSVTSTPAGAKVYLDGNYIGNTPIAEYKVSTGEHKLKVILNSKKEYSKTITMGPGERFTVHVFFSSDESMSSPTSQTESESTSEGGGTVCGPGLVGVLALVVLLLRRH